MIVQAAGEVLGQAIRVDEGSQVWRGQQGLDLGGEQVAAAGLGEVEGLDAEVVPAEHDDRHGGTFVEDGEGPHAVEAREAPEAPGLVGGEDDLGVAGRGEAATGSLELAAQLPEVVDLAVVDEVNVARRARHRLVAVLEVDDRQAPVAEAGEVLLEVALVVGPPVLDPLAHGREEVVIRWADEAGDPAHRSLRTSPGGLLPAPELALRIPIARSSPTLPGGYERTSSSSLGWRPVRASSGRRPAMAAMILLVSATALFRRRPSPATGGPTRTVTVGAPSTLASFGRRAERGQTASVFHRPTGTTAAPVEAASRAAPVLPWSTGSKKACPRGIVPCGRMTSPSPARRTRSAGTRAPAAAAARSTGMPPRARAIGPATGRSNSSALARNRVGRPFRPTTRARATTSK